MQTTLRYNVEQAVKHWWIMLVIGIMFLASGIMTFVFPAASFLSLAFIFGMIIFLTGVFELIFAWSKTYVVDNRGWLTAMGIIQLILGVLLMVDLGLSMVTMPIFLGFWLLMRSFTMIGTGIDMHQAQAGGWGWLLFWGALLLICSIFILVYPLVYGAEAVIVWVGVSMLAAGFSSISFGWHLKGLHLK